MPEPTIRSLIIYYSLQNTQLTQYHPRPTEGKGLSVNMYWCHLSLGNSDIRSCISPPHLPASLHSLTIDTVTSSWFPATASSTSGLKETSSLGIFFIICSKSLHTLDIVSLAVSSLSNGNSNIFWLVTFLS